MQAVQRTFNWSIKAGRIEHNPLAAVEKPSATRRETYLWPEQYEQLLGHIRDGAFRDYVEILRHTGCRPEEARIVEARHFRDEEACWILPTTLTKGKKKPRTILLNDRALDICNRLIDSYSDSSNGPLFRRPSGAPWTSHAVVERFRRIRTRVGFYVTAYSIRHTFATDAILAGVDLVTIAEIMGHSSLQILSQVYQHVSQRQDHLRKGLIKATGYL